MIWFKRRFDCNGHNAPAYGCSKPGDHSGDYYPAADVDAYRAKVRALVAKLENDWDSDWPMPPCVLEFLHDLAALEAEDD